MRFVRDDARDPEDTFDEDDWKAATPVGKISYSSMEEGELCSPPRQRSSLESDSSMDNYQISAVRQAEHERNRRYMIEITVGSVTGEAMIDSGCPISFLDFKSASQIVAENKGVIRALANNEPGPKDTDFNGNEVKRAGVLTTKLTCGEWQVPLAEFHVLQPNAPMCMLLGADLMPLVGLELTQMSPSHPRGTEHRPGKLNIR